MAKQLAKHGITACVLQHFTTQKTTFDITAKYENHAAGCKINQSQHLDVRKEIINFVKTLSNHKNDLQAMNFFKALFGGKEEKPEDKKKAEEEKDYDVLKYDGVRALRSGQYDYAIRCFTHALGMKEDLEIRDYASQAMIRADRLPEAFEQLRKIAEAQPENMQVFIRMANVAYMMEDYTAMADACEKAILIDNTDAEAVYLYAKACIGHGDTTNAIAMLTKALTLNPEYHEARLLRAETLLSTNDTDGADEDTTQLMKNNLENEDILILKARIERAKGNANNAILYYDKTIEANPFNANAYKERGELKTEMGDRTNGLNDIKYATELLNQQDGNAGNENIEKKVGDAYKNANPFGV